MNLDRKTFLRGVGAGALGLLAGRALSAAPLGPAPSAPIWNDAEPELFWKRVRESYPMTTERVYFNTGGLGPAPSRVLDMLALAGQQLQNRVETGHELFAQSRSIAAGFFGVAPEEICFTRNATEGNCIVSAGLDLHASDEVIFETHAHPGGSFPWLNRQRQAGIVVKTFEPDQTSAEGNLQRIAALITPRTRVIQVSHITATTGLLMPVAAIAKLAHEHGCWFHVDGAQSAGTLRVNLPALGCDSYATSGHKWLGAPHETGVLFIRRDKLDSVAPSHVGAYTSDDWDFRGAFNYVPSAQRYEYGTRSAASVSALVEAMRFQDDVGRDRIAARGRALAARVRAGLAKIGDVEILSPASPALASAMVTFRSPRIGHEKLFGRLLTDYKLRCRPVSEVGLNATRVSTHIFNSPEECDRLIGAVEEIVKHA